MRRRNFITLLGGVAAAWPLGAHAQQGDRMRRLGILMAGAESDPQYQADVAVFREGLQKLGWQDGQNIRIEVRWAGFNAETMRRYAKELIALQPDLMSGRAHAAAISGGAGLEHPSESVTLPLRSVTV